MVLKGKTCLLLLVLACWPVFGSPSVSSQTNWWLRAQVPKPAPRFQGSSRGSAGETPYHRLAGLSSLRGGTQNRRWPYNHHSQGLPRQMQGPSLSSPISIQCTEESIVVMVNRNFYGNGILAQASELSLGSQSCNASPESNDTTIVFLNSLQDCGSTLQVTAEYVIYSSILSYNPLPTDVIIRSNPAVVPITCFYPRHGNVSSKAIMPTWSPFSTTVSSHDKLFFSLHLMAEDWSGPSSSSIFQLGQNLNIEASVETENHMDLLLFVDSCVATVTPDVESTPNYMIISANGCFMDAMRDDTFSAFRSPRVQRDRLQFTIEAFRFQGADASVIFITCSLRAVSASQVPDPMNKACSYNRNSNSWSPLEGSSDICQCCFSGACQPSAVQGSRWGSVGRLRGFGKRRTGSHSDEHREVFLGPLMVIAPEDLPAPRTGLGHLSKTTSESQTLELWMLVGSTCVGLVAFVAAAIWTGKLLLNRFSHKAVEQ